ncbi:MAG: hypothetical protein K1000chlam2_01264 [Chlamydiae bacterium]|nr:hypothetical protein [Chlamydiota bacterium]
MQIMVKYPLVMKMEMSTYHAVTEETTLSQLKQEIFDFFWKCFLENSSVRGKVHGGPKNIELLTEEKQIVADDAYLQRHIKPERIFEAIFIKGIDGMQTL